MKKVLIIGAGAQGNVISGILAAESDVEAIVLGDINLERAAEIVQLIGTPKIRIVRQDAVNTAELPRLMKKEHFALAINATLPAYDRPILQACLAAGVNYLDMASSEILNNKNGTSIQQEFLVEQLDYDDAFKDAGLQALILAGGDSGLVNVMARDAADAMEEIDYIGIKDYGIVACERPVALWSLVTYLEDCAAAAIYWEDGQYKRAPIFSGEEEYYFPAPLDCKGKVYYHAHEEPVTIPRFIGKPVKYCDFKLGDPFSQTWRFLIQGLGLTDTEPVELNGRWISPRDVLFKKVPSTLTARQCLEMVETGQIMSRLQLAVDVKGYRGRQYLHYKMWTESPNIVEACRRIPGTNDVSWLTSVPASILALMLLRGQLKHRGVFPCEVLEPTEREIFFRGIQHWDIRVHQQIHTEL